MGHFEDNLDYLETEFDLIGRDDETKELIYRISSGNMLLIEGDKGVGKTALLKHAVDNFRGEGKVVYVDIGTFGKRFDVAKVLNGKPKGMILLIDNIEYLCEENNKKIKYFYDQNYIRSVVFTTTNCEKINFTDAIRSRLGRNILKLKKLKKGEVLSTARERLGEDADAFSKEVLDKLFKDSKNLKEFLVSCNSLCECLNEEDREKVELEDLDNLVGDFDNKDVETCLECDGKLVEAGKHWRCEACDEFCRTCGFLREEEDAQCPKCGADFGEDKK